MSFRQFGGINYAAKHNIVSSNYNTSNNLLVTQTVGQPNSYIQFLSDISGNINIDISGNITCNGNLYVSENVDISGNTQMDGNLNVNGNTFIGQNLGVGENTIIYQNLDVNGNTLIGQNLDIYNNLYVKNNIDCSGNLNVNINADISGNALIGNNLYVSKDVDIYGSTQIYGNLDISGNITGQTGSFSYLYSTNNTYLATENEQSVGIGKMPTLPGYVLDVSGNVAISGTTTCSKTLFLNNISNDSTSLNIASSLGIYLDGSGDGIFLNNGNVGIGKTIASYSLDVSGNISSTNINPTLYLTSNPIISTSDNPIGSIIFDNGGSNSSIKSYLDVLGANNNSDLRFYTSLDYNSYNQNLERMRIDRSGNVGIGTTSPSQILDVSGNAIITGNLTIGSGYSNGLVCGSTRIIDTYNQVTPTSSTQTIFTNNSPDGYYSFITNDASGIQYSPMSISWNDVDINVKNTTINGNVFFNSNEGDPDLFVIFNQFDSSLNQPNYWVYQPEYMGYWNNINDTTNWNIQNTGDATFLNVNAQSFNSTSDYRLKTNVKKLDNYTIDNLKPVEYDINGRHDMGFIAHELQEYYPFLVEGEKDGEKMQSINYNSLIALLVKEIQDLKTEIKELKLNNFK